MKKPQIITSLSLYIFSKPFCKITEIEKNFNLDLDSIYDYLDDIRVTLESIGLEIEVIEVNKEDYCIIYGKTKERILSDPQLGLLTVIAYLCKYRGGYISQEIKEIFDSYYLDEMSFLENNFYIEKQISRWTITPLTILTLFPVLERSEILIKKLIPV